MKRFSSLSSLSSLSCLLLSALLIVTLIFPASAAVKVRGYSGFSDIPTDSTYFGAVKTCYETGLLNGKTETAFAPQDSLSIAQLVAITARLYDLEQGGKGEIPALPSASIMKNTCLRFYDENGKLLKSFKPGDSVEYTAAGSSFYICLSKTPDDPALPESCTLEIGLRGYGSVRRYQGTRQSYAPLPSPLLQGLEGTGYNFTNEEAAIAALFFLGAEKEVTERVKNAWWYPSMFYLASEGQLRLSSVVNRVRPDDVDVTQYDPLTGFNAPASRALFAWMVDAVTGELEVLHKTVTVPDVDPNETRDAEEILRLYQAGVLTGVDKAGNFKGSAPLTRGQAALLLNRVLDPGARV